MKNSLSPVVKAFLLNPPTDTGLIFDLSAMRLKILQSKDALKQNHLSFAIKSFPEKSALSKLLPVLSFADVSNLVEYQLLGEATKRIDFTVWLTRCPVTDLEMILSQYPACTINYTVEDTDNVSGVIELAEKYKFFLSLRIKSQELMDADHPLTHESRFGLSLTEVRTILTKHPRSFTGIHIHHGSQRNDLELMKLFITKLTSFKDKFPQLINFNVGGGWDLGDPDIQKAVSESEVLLTLEPGRFFSESCGYAFCRIERFRKTLDGTFIEVRLSPEASLKWLQNPRVHFIPSGKETSDLAHPLHLSGPSCFEGDKLKLTESGRPAKAAVGDILVITNVSGYSLAWNTSFNGIYTPVYFIGHEN